VVNDETHPFVPFKVPTGPDDTPLVQWDRDNYKCTGCGGPVPDGVWLHETVEDGMVVGLLARVGADGPVVHQCGKAGE
jgi:hypothetical protein